MGINGGRGIRGSGAVLGGGGISLSGGGTPSFSFGNALQFDGVDDYVTIASGGVAAGLDDLTFSLWFKTGAIISNDYVFSKSSSGIGLNIASSTTITMFDLAARNFTVPAMSTDTWYHLFFAGNNSLRKGRIWLNGLESSSGELTVDVDSYVINELGRRAISPKYTDFTFDEFVVYVGYQGNGTDAAAFYNSGNGEFPSVALPSQTPTAYWKFNGTSGDTTAIDEQGTYNGTLNNFNTSTCWVAH